MRVLMEQKGVSQAKMARALNVSTSTINGYLTGKRFPDLMKLNMIADYLETTTDHLVGRIVTKGTGSFAVNPLEKQLLRFFRQLDSCEQHMILKQISVFLDYHTNTTEHLGDHVGKPEHW